MNNQNHLWAIVVASDPQSDSNPAEGHSRRAVPRPFRIASNGLPSLTCALRLADRLVPPRRTLVVVNEAERLYWGRLLSHHPWENIVSQAAPGTAAGLLHAFIRMFRQDPKATIVAVDAGCRLMEKEETLLDTLAKALKESEKRAGRVVLIGSQPRFVERGRNWIEPLHLHESAATNVLSVCSDPTFERCVELAHNGALLWTGCFVASSQALLSLYEHAAPWLLRLFLRRGIGKNASRFAETCNGFPGCSFARYVLSRSPTQLSVLPEPAGEIQSSVAPQGRAEALEHRSQVAQRRSVIE